MEATRPWASKVVARARTREARVAQVEAWLRKHYPPPQPTRVLWVDIIPVEPDENLRKAERERGDHGICYMTDKGECRILLSRRTLTVSSAVETTLHEWAHALFKRPGHHDAFWRKYGAIYRHFFERGGWEDSAA